MSDWTDGQVDYFPNRVKRDNCRIVANPDQADANGNGVGDACEVDSDGDGTFDTEDNCRETPNAGQADMDGDRVGDVCDNDIDGDFVRNNVDNCPQLANPQVPPNWIQPDADGDRIGTACDPDEGLPPAPTPTPGPAGGPSGPQPGGGTSVEVDDRQAPRVVVRLKARQKRAEVEDGLIVRVDCSEACAAKVELVADRKLARRLKRRVVATGSAALAAPGTTYAFVRFDRRARRGLWKLKRSSLTVRVAATDPSGNRRRVSERFTLAA